MQTKATIVITLDEFRVQRMKDLSLCRQYYLMYEQKMDVKCELGWNWAVAKELRRGTEFICDWEKMVKQ
jgi:hypothetical protein